MTRFKDPHSGAQVESIPSTAVPCDVEIYKDGSDIPCSNPFGDQVNFQVYSNEENGQIQYYMKLTYNGNVTSLQASQVETEDRSGQDCSVWTVVNANNLFYIPNSTPVNVTTLNLLMCDAEENAQGCLNLNIQSYNSGGAGNKYDWRFKRTPDKG